MGTRKIFLCKQPTICSSWRHFGDSSLEIQGSSPGEYLPCIFSRFGVEEGNKQDMGPLGVDSGRHSYSGHAHAPPSSPGVRSSWFTCELSKFQRRLSSSKLAKRG